MFNEVIIAPEADNWSSEKEFRVENSGWREITRIKLNLNLKDQLNLSKTINFMFGFKTTLKCSFFWMKID